MSVPARIQIDSPGCAGRTIHRCGVREYLTLPAAHSVAEQLTQRFIQYTPMAALVLLPAASPAT